MLETPDEGTTLTRNALEVILKTSALTTVNFLAMHKGAHWGKLSSLNLSRTEQNLTVFVVSDSL